MFAAHGRQMPPPQGAALASLGHKCERRRSSTSNIYDIRDIVVEAFADLDTDGNGKLTVEEVAQGLKRILDLNDPTNEADSICAAIDKDGDGHIDIDEFFAYIQPTCVKWLAAGKQLMVEDILADAFRSSIAHDKAERDAIIEAFMASQKEVLKNSKVSGQALDRAWADKIFEELYNRPSDPSAPVYKSRRGDYLKQKLVDILAAQAQPVEKPRQQFERRSSVPTAVAPADAAVLKKAAFRKQIASSSGADDGSLSTFCQSWLSNLDEISRRTPSSNDSSPMDMSAVRNKSAQ